MSWFQRGVLLMIIATIVRCSYPLKAHEFMPLNFDKYETHSTWATPKDAMWDRARTGELGEEANLIINDPAIKGQPINLETIGKVNKMVNKSIRYVRESSDNWSPVAETLARGTGDCEDFAIAKMRILSALGVPEKDVYLVIGYDVMLRSYHAVLAVELNGEIYYLDNVTNKTIALNTFFDFKPMLSYNNTGKWVHLKA